MRRAVAQAFLLAAALGWTARAAAYPEFARKYAVACTACHESWPKLNDQGGLFRDNGFQWGTHQDAPVWQNPAYWPIGVRGGLGYQYSSLSGQQTNAGPTTLDAGRLGYTNLKIMMVGTIVHDVSFMIKLQPLLTNAGMNPQYPSPTAALISPGQIGMLEYFWLRFDNLAGSPWLNVKAGLSELDLPFDQDETLTPLSPYLIYQYHPGGAANFMPFALGASQFEVAIEGHSRDDTTRYSIALTQTQDDPGSALPLASPGVYAHVQQTVSIWPHRIPEATVGLMGMAGSYPTMALYSGGPIGTPSSGPLVLSTGASARAPQSCADPDDCGSADTGLQAASNGPSVVPGSAYALREFYKEGVDVSVDFGELALPLAIEATYILGQEDPAFIANATREALYQGGFVEADWTPSLHVTFGGRWDFVRNLQQADPTAAGNFLDADQTTAFLRYAFELPLRTALTLHLELSWRRVIGGAFDGSNFDGYLAFGGIDFAF
ncbi:MAG: hypothetical protein ACYDCL_05590 [Myxococcales bacterium]